MKRPLTSREVKEWKSFNRDLCKFLFSPWTPGLSEDFLTNNDADYYLFKFELLQKECKSRQFARDLFKRVISNLEMKKRNSHEEAAFFLIGEILPHLERSIFVLGDGLSSVRALLTGKAKLYKLGLAREARSAKSRERKSRCLEIADDLEMKKGIKRRGESRAQKVAEIYNKEVDDYNAEPGDHDMRARVSSEAVRKYFRNSPPK